MDSSFSLGGKRSTLVAHRSILVASEPAAIWRGPVRIDTGHRGALSTLHANSPADALRRLETLALTAGVGLPHAAIREQLGRGFELVVHLERLADGRRVVAEIAEVVRVAGGPATRGLVVRESD